MNIIIVGCGEIGQSLAEQLSADDNNITVIDTSAEKVNGISTRLDVLGIVGNGATHAVQEEAGIEDADLLIAVTGSDELNLLCCTVAKKSSDCQTIARVKRPEYSKDVAFLKEELGLAMVINPQLATAQEIARVLRFPAAIKIDTFGGGLVELIKFRIPEDSILTGLSVREVMSELRCDLLICTVERGEEALIPRADLVFEAKDVISVVATPKNAAEFFEKIGYRANAVGNVMIAGGDDTAHYLCDLLAHTSIDVKIIERQASVCEEISMKFPDIAVINANEGSCEVLGEEGLADSDALVCLTRWDEENILLSLFAKNNGVRKVVTKINRFDFDSVISRLDLDTVLYPNNVTSEMIVRFVRAMKNGLGSNVERLYHVIRDKVEAAEFILREPSALTNVPLSELSFKKNILVAAIVRKGKVIIPHGRDQLEVGDHVVIVSETIALQDATDILR